MFAGFGIGVFVGACLGLLSYAVYIKKLRDDVAKYKKRWQEATKLLEQERVSPLSEGEQHKSMDNGSDIDYHTLNWYDREGIAKERYEKGLPIEDDLEGKSREYYSGQIENIAQYRLKQQREAESNGG